MQLSVDVLHVKSIIPCVYEGLAACCRLLLRAEAVEGEDAIVHQGRQQSWDGIATGLGRIAGNPGVRQPPRVWTHLRGPLIEHVNAIDQTTQLEVT